MQRSPRSFHGLLSDVTDMEPVLINTAELRLSSAVLPGFHGNAATQTSQAAALCIPAVLCWAQGALSEAGVKRTMEIPGQSSRARTRCSLAQFIPLSARYPTSWSYPFILVFDHKGHMRVRVFN